MPIDLLMSRGRNALVALALIAASFGLAAPAATQSADIQSLNDRLDLVSRDVAVLRQQLSNRGGAPIVAPSGGVSGGSGLAEQMDSRFAAVEEKLNQLTAQVEQINFNLGQLKQRVDRMQTDTDFRLSQLEKGGAGATPPAATPTANAATPPAAPGLAPGPKNLTPPDPKAPKPATPPPAAAAATSDVKLPGGTVQEQYDYAFGFLKDGDYPRAETALRAFVAGNASDPLAGNAQYWLGETHFARANYAEAATQFLQGYEKYPKSAKAPDILLKLGLSLENLGKNSQACAAFGHLNEEYPNAQPYVKRRASEERARLKCPA